MSSVSKLVNANPALQGRLNKKTDRAEPPVTATPVATVGAVGAAKAAGSVVGAGVVAAAAYAAYRTVAK